MTYHYCGQSIANTFSHVTAFVTEMETACSTVLLLSCYGAPLAHHHWLLTQCEGFIVRHGLGLGHGLGLMAKRPRTQQTLSFYFGGHPGQPDSESSSDSDEELTSRRFLPRWSKKFPWVNYDDVNDVVTCTVCAKAGKRNDYVAGKPRPPRGWRKEYLNRHKNSVDHRNATKEPCMAAQAQNMYEHMNLKMNLTILWRFKCTLCDYVLYVFL